MNQQQLDAAAWTFGQSFEAGLFRLGQEQGVFRVDMTPEVLARNFSGMTEAAMRSITYCPDDTRQHSTSEEMVALIMEGAGK